MPSSLIYFHFVPFAGFLTDISVLIFLYYLPLEHRYRTAFVVGYLGMAAWNFLTFLNYVSDVSESYRLLYYFYFASVLMIPNGFLLFAMRLTRQDECFVQRTMAVALALSLACFGLLSLWFFVPGWETSFLLGVRVAPWGKAPVLAWGAMIYHAVLYLIMALGYFLLVRHLWRNRTDRRSRLILLLFAMNGFGSLSNLAAWHGINSVPPLGNGIDAVTSAALAAFLFREEYLRQFARVLFRVAGAFASMGVSLVIVWFVAEFVLRALDDVTNLLPVMVLASVLALTFFQLLFSQAVAGESFESTYERLRKDYRLTHQEAVICRYVGEARDRKEILAILNISQNTLKVQLTSVYRKTIDRQVGGEVVPAPRHRSKFDELATFVADLKSPQPQWSNESQPTGS